jgi:hypothetical protein
MKIPRGPVLRFGPWVLLTALVIVLLFSITTSEYESDLEYAMRQHRETVTEVLEYLDSGERTDRRDHQARLKLGNLEGSDPIGFGAVLGELSLQELRSLDELMHNGEPVDPFFEQVESFLSDRFP